MAKTMNKTIAKYILSEIDDRRHVSANNQTLGTEDEFKDQITLLSDLGYLRAKFIKNNRVTNGGYLYVMAKEITHSGRSFLATL